MINAGVRAAATAYMRTYSASFAAHGIGGSRHVLGEPLQGAQPEPLIMQTLRMYSQKIAAPNEKVVAQELVHFASNRFLRNSG